MNLKIVETQQGATLIVKVSAGSRRNELRGIHDEVLKLAVTPVADKGKANEAVLSLLSASLDYPKSDLRIVSGSTRSEKKILFAGQKKEQLVERINQYLS